MITTVTVLVCICVCIYCIYLVLCICSWYVCVLCDTLSTKTMWSACDLSFPPLADSRLGVPLGTEARKCTTDRQVHHLPQHCKVPKHSYMYVHHHASELLRLTEALVSSIERDRELTRGSSLGGTSAIDDVGSESVATVSQVASRAYDDEDSSFIISSQVGEVQAWVIQNVTFIA